MNHPPLLRGTFVAVQPLPPLASFFPHSVRLTLFFLLFGILSRSLEAQRIAPPPPANQGVSLPPTAATATGKLTLKACCGDSEQNCEEFQRPEEMFGIACCGNQVINQFEEICCENVVRRRRQPSSYIDRCCGSQTLAYDQTCCQGVVHNIPNGECCGGQAYPRNNVNVLCCNGQLNVNVEPGLVCCGNTPYDGGLRETCCGDSVFLKELFDGCCPVPVDTSAVALPTTRAKSIDPAAPAPPQFHQFNSKTHQCCDVPIELYSKTKCCYLRSKLSGQFQPKSYDSSTSCCAYPYSEITPKDADGQCVAPPPKNPQRDDPNESDSDSESDSESTGDEEEEKSKEHNKGDEHHDDKGEENNKAEENNKSGKASKNDNNREKKEQQESSTVYMSSTTESPAVDE